MNLALRCLLCYGKYFGGSCDRWPQASPVGYPGPLGRKDFLVNPRMLRSELPGNGIEPDTVRNMKHRLVWLVACAALAGACAKKRPVAVPIPGPATGPTAPRPVTSAPQTGAVERGIASWYGHPYHGRQAANGEIYDMEQMVAAHKTLPFQTMVRVRNLTNNQTVDVRIIDRGPFIRGRIIDLSHKAAQDVGVIGPGVAEVELTILSSPLSAVPGYFSVQVGAFADKANADRMAGNMKSRYGASKLALRRGEPPLWRVLAGRAESTGAAEQLAQTIRVEQKVPEAFVVRLDP